MKMKDVVKRARVERLYTVTVGNVPLTDRIEKKAGKIRLKSNIRLFDSLHLATPIESNINYFITTDDKIMYHNAIINPFQLNEIGIEALSNVLSPVDVARFLRLYDKGTGEYTTEQETDFDGLTMDDIHASLKALRKHQ